MKSKAVTARYYVNGTPSKSTGLLKRGLLSLRSARSGGVIRTVCQGGLVYDALFRSAEHPVTQRSRPERATKGWKKQTASAAAGGDLMADIFDEADIALDQFDGAVLDQMLSTFEHNDDDAWVNMFSLNSEEVQNELAEALGNCSVTDLEHEEVAEISQVQEQSLPLESEPLFRLERVKAIAKARPKSKKDRTTEKDDLDLQKCHIDGEVVPPGSRYNLRRRGNPEWRLRRLGDLVQSEEIVALARRAGVERVSAASVEEMRRALIDFITVNIEALATIKGLEDITEHDVDAMLEEKRIGRF